MPPTSFTDSQLDQVLAGALPLHECDHAAYLQAVADLLHDVSEPGDGDVHRAVKEAQRKFFDPPLDTAHAPALLRKIGR
jgi:hypothetical protein